MDGNWTSSDLYAQLNLGPNLLCHLGHSYVGYCMTIYNSDLTTYNIYNNGINHNFFNGYTQGCYAGSFDNRNDYGGYESYDCFSEKISTMPTAALTFIANSRYGWYRQNTTNGASQIFNREWIDVFFDDGIYSIGAANQISKEHAIPFIEARQAVRWCAYELNVFGDPAVELWTEPPAEMSPHIMVSPDTVEIIVEGGSYEYCLPGPEYEVEPNNYCHILAEIVEEGLPLPSSSETNYQLNQSPSISKFQSDVDTLYYDDGTMERSLGIKGGITPSTDETYGFATKFEYVPTSLMGVLIYFRTSTASSYRLYVWPDNNGVPASGDPIYSELYMPAPVPNTWNYVDLEEFGVSIPTPFWIGVCYNNVTTPSEWYLGFDENTPDDHTYINLGGTPSDWQCCGNLGYGYAYGVRAIVEAQQVPCGTMTVGNIGTGILSVSDIIPDQEWITSVSPSTFVLQPDSTQSVTIRVYAEGLESGIYYGTLQIFSNDPDESPYNQPVKLIVTEPGIGDFNSDGYVDAADLQLLGDHWHFVDTDPGWDPIYDLVPDGIIDAADLQVLGDHWHEGTPPKVW
jgi:hypothetical protein